MAALKILILALLALATAQDDDQFYPRGAMAENLKKLGNANNYFALNFLRKLSLNSQENLFFSPFTIFSVLSMLYKGAKGETAEELRKTLGYHRAKVNDSVIFSTYNYYLTEVLARFDPRTYKIYCTSALIVDSSFPLRNNYRTQVQNLFDAYVEDVDMAQDSLTVADKLNTWVKIKTKGEIKSIVESIDPETVLLLLSAAYFKGSWRIQFDPNDTKLHPFYNGGNRSNGTNVMMMHTSANYRYYEPEEGFSAIELSYEGRSISMIIFLPVEDDGLYLMEQNLSPSKMALVRRRMYYRKVHLTVPKFKLSFDRDISVALKKCGANKVFTSTSDLSGMTRKENALSLSKVKHKSMIDVNEKGTVAAAISSVIMTKMLPTSEEVPDFKVNHPFLFTLVDTRSGLVLFVGRINKL